MFTCVPSNIALVEDNPPSLAMRCRRPFTTFAFCPQGPGFLGRQLARASTISSPCKKYRGGSWRPTARLLPLETGLMMEVIDVPPTVDTTTAPPEPHLILFVHGSLHGAWCFKYFQSYFADRGYLTKAISLRGCGESQIDQTTSTTIDQHIGDLNDAIPKLVGSTPPILVGHSNGCFYIQKWLEQNTTVPVPSTVFLTPIPPSGVSKMVMRTMKKQGLWNALRIALGIMRKAMTKEVLFCRRLLFSKKDAEGFSEQLEGDQKLQEYMHLMGKTKLTLDGRSFKKTVQSTGTFTGKAIVLGGTNDVLVDQEGLEETAQMWNADLHIFDDAPHELMLYSKWEDVAELILKWLQEQNPVLEPGTNQQPNSI